jgi:hypothetical protein
MSSELHQKLYDARINWEEARRIARESRDKKAVSEMQQARKVLYRAMKRLEELTRYASATIEPELKKQEVEAYKRLLKIEKAFDLERRNQVFTHKQNQIMNCMVVNPSQPSYF